MSPGPARTSACATFLQCASKLPQEAQVAALQPADIVDRVPHHDKPGEAQAEGEAVPLGGIDAADAKHAGIHETAWKQFHPAAVLADGTAAATADQTLDIQLEAGLDERKEAGPE